MNWTIIPLEAKAEWRSALEGIPHGFAHTWEFNYAMSHTRNLSVSLYCYEAGNLRIVCPLVEREFKGYIDIVKPFGFNGFVGNGPCEEFPAEWRRFASERGYICGYLGIHPYHTDATYYLHEEAHTYNAVFVLDLTLSEDELVHRMPERIQRYIIQYQGKRSDIVMEKEILKEFLISNYGDFIISRGANSSSQYNFSTETLSYLASLDNVFMIGKSGTGGIEAVVLFTYTPFGGESFCSASIGEGRRHNREIYWEGIKQLKALGVPLINFGGGFTPSDGIATFKKRFGSNSLDLKCLKQVYDKDRYFALCQQAGVDPDSVDFFPAYYWKGQ
jgi:hypothetical protein